MARIELGAQAYDQTCTLDGQPSVALSIYQLPGSNALEIAQLRPRQDGGARRAAFPTGVDYAIVYDTTPFINESINEVFKTLRDAVILVAVVVLLFLQNWRSAIIPLIAVPVAIIGTFAVMAALGFSLNNLTLFGLVLAIGIVVDDAIVVVEAVEHHIEHGLSPRDATLKAMEQVSGPVIAVGLVLSAVFVPCAFITRHHRAVLPAVRPDDRRLDGDLGVQLADAQPGADGAAAAAARQEHRRRRCRWLAFVAGRRLAGLGVLDALARRWRSAAASALTAEHAAPWIARRAAARSPAAGRQLAAQSRPGLRRSAPSTWASTSPTASTRGWSAGCCASACWCWSVYGGLLGLTYVGFDADAHGLHPAAGQGLSAGQRAAARLGLGAAAPKR